MVRDHLLGERVRKRHSGRGSVVAVLFGAALALAPTASALDLPVAVPALPPAPQVSNPLPPLNTAVPAPAPQPPVSVAVPASPPIAAPVPIASPIRTAPIGASAGRLPTVTAAAPASADPAAGAQLSPREERIRRAATRTRRVRR